MVLGSSPDKGVREALNKSSADGSCQFRVYLKIGNMTNSEGFFRLMKPFFRRNTLCIAGENGAQQAEKTRCLGMLTVFG